MDEFRDGCGVAGINRKSRRLAAADGGAAGVMVGRDQGYYHQRSTMMLLDSMGG